MDGREGARGEARLGQSGRGEARLDRVGREDSVKRGGRFERAGGRLTLNPRAEPAEWGARKASRRSSVAARTKSPGGTTRQYSARDHRECTRDVRYFASPRLASPPFVSPPKVNFCIDVHTHVYALYIQISVRRTNSSDLSFSIFLSSLLSSSLPSVFFIYANRHIAPSNARENNSTPSFLFARSSLTGKK